jgi:nicotinamidase/pyrazinamidase
MPYSREYSQYGVIYAIISPDNMYYIGQTTKSLRERWKYYKSLNCRGQLKLYRALKKYGVENFIFKVIEYCHDQTHLDCREKHLIEKYDAIKNGYNIQLGGYKQKFTPEICKKISDTKKERNKGKIHNWQGKHHSEESKKKMSLVRTGVRIKPHTEEWKKKMSERFKGKNNPFFGIQFFLGQKHTTETKNKISKSNSRLYRLTDPNKNTWVVHNLKNFCREKNLNNSLLVATSTGRRKTHQGWKAKKMKRGSMNKVCLFIIDPQVDFTNPSGSLFVPGADKDMLRLSTMIKRVKKDIDDIVVSCDSHRSIHIAHPIWWVDNSGKHPKPFTLIDENDVIGSNPKWKAYNPGYQERSVNYVKALKKNNRYVLCIWPPHCLIGSTGATLDPTLFNSLCEWEALFASVNFIPKGSNPFTEHYSIFKADVFDQEDSTTGLNTDLITLLQNMDLIAIAGEAGSHCVCNSIRDLASNFGDENIKKLVLLSDCTSPVPGFEKLQEDFINEMVGKGMEVTTSDKFLI